MQHKKKKPYHKHRSCNAIRKGRGRWEKQQDLWNITREKPKERNPLTRLSDWKEYSAPFSDEKLSRQGARCMDCATPFCHMGMEINRATYRMSNS